MILFTCNWNAYSGLDTAGAGHLSYPPGVYPVKVNCLGQINPGIILKAFENGADGVLLLGCPPGECHYEFGYQKAEEVFQETRELVAVLGYRESQLQMGWVSAGDGQGLVKVVAKFMKSLNGRGSRA